MANFYDDNEDLKFYIEKYVDWESLVSLVENNFKLPDGFSNTDEATDFYRDFFSMLGNFVADEIAPKIPIIEKNYLKLVDGEVVEAPELTKIFEQMHEMGLHGLCLPREFGGMNAPLLCYMLGAELIARADVSIMTHHSFHGGMSLAMLLFSAMEGSTEIDHETQTMVRCRFQKEIEDMVTNGTWGAMDITEPNAGSDMGALRSKGEQDEEGNWFVTGEKSFISSGHGKYHFVIARTEPEPEEVSDPMAGLGGLSFFLVPTYEDTPEGRVRYAKVDRLEEKLGHKNSATCAMVFDRSPAHLIGNRGDGFRYMLALMNNARVAVGFESIGLAEAAYRMAKSYAEGRHSMGKPIEKHEMIADYLRDMKTEVQVLRALGVEAAFQSEMAQRSEINLKIGIAEDDIEREKLKRLNRRHLRKARRLTPLLKYRGAEKAVELSRMAMQIHGGVGYTTEFGAEKLLRDSLVLPIYEGTSQIQALMATKDTLLGDLKRPRVLVQKIAQVRWRSVSARDSLERKVNKLLSCALGAEQTILSRVFGDKLKTLSDHKLREWPEHILKNWDPKRDFSFAMLHAERFTQLLSDAAVAELLWEQAQRFPERRELLARFLEKGIPRAEYLQNMIATTGEEILEELHGLEEGRDDRLFSKVG